LEVSEVKPADIHPGHQSWKEVDGIRHNEAMMLEKHTTKNGIHCSSKKNKQIRELNINKLVKLLLKKYTITMV